MKHNQINLTKKGLPFIGKLIWILLLIFFSQKQQSFGQLLTEPFNYTVHATDGLSKQSSNVWKIINSGDSILVAAGNLSYPGLPASTGNSITYGGAGTDYYTTFTSQSSGTVYYSFLLDVTSLGTLGTTGGYTIGLIDGTTSSFVARCFLRASGANYNVGINAGSAVANVSFASNTLVVGTTYLIVVSHQLIAGLSNDVSKVWINPAIGVAEPASDATSTNATATDVSTIQRIFLRQDNTTNTPGTLIIDEIRVGTTWSAATPAGDVATLGNITQPTSDLIQGTTNAVIAGFTLNSILSKDFTSVTVTGGGTAQATDISNFRIYRDQGTLGVIDGGDASVSGSGIALTGSMNFTISGETGITTARNYLIVADVAAGADVTRNVQASIGSGAFVTTAASNVGSATGSVRNFIGAATPLITLTGTLTAFTTAAGTPSATQSYSVTGANLTADITVTPPADFQVRTGANAFSSSPITLTQTGGSVSISVDVRYNPTIASTTSGNITHISSGATQKNEAVSGNSIPTITLTGTLTPFTTVIGTPSATQSYSVTGANLSADITVTPPVDFEVRTGANLFSASPITLTQVGGNVSISVDVRYNPAIVGSASGNITHTSAGAVQKNEAVSGSSIAVSPTTQATVTFGSVTNNSIVINFSGGDGANRIVVVKNASAVTYLPSDGFASTGVNSFYFAATDKGTGNKIVYDGSGNTVTVTGLDHNLRYFVATYEYNGTGTGINYLTTSPGTGSDSTLSLVRVPVPMASQGGLSYTANFNDEANWGDDFNFGTGAQHWASVGVINLGGNIPDPLHTSVSTATFTTTSASGGLQRGSLVATGSNNVPGTLVQLSTNATDNVNANAIDFLLNFTGVSAGTLSFNWAVVFNGTGDRLSSLRVYTSTDGSTFTELPAADVLNKANNVVASGSITSIALPASFTNSATARIRFYEHNGTGTSSAGSRAKISIDNVTVLASVPPTKLAITNINPASPTRNSPFSVTVQSQDVSNTPQNVFTNTNVTLSKNTGTGILTGTLTGTILAGTNSVVISGVLYDVAETGVSLTATRTAGDILIAGNSVAFEVIPPAPVITVTGSLTTFLTGVGTISDPQTYTVSGQFLQGDIVIFPPAQIEISVNGNPFSNASINLTPTNGTLAPTTVSVRYAPSAPGPFNDLIAHFTTNGSEVDLPVSGLTSTTEPTTASTLTFGCPTTTSLIVNFTGGNGSKRIVVARAGASVSFTPTDHNAYAGANSDFNIAPDQGSGNKLVYDGSGNTVTVTNLSPGTDYFFAVYEYNGSGSITEYLTSSFGSGDKLTLGFVDYATTGSTYTQDFDGLPFAGTFAISGKGPFLVSGCPINASNASGWQFGKDTSAVGGTGASAAFKFDDGTGTAGSVYSYGTSLSNERALGSLASSSIISRFGAALVNKTLVPLQTVTISYTGEQWRNGGSGSQNTLAFSYSLNGSDIFTGTFDTVPLPGKPLDFKSPVVSITPAALNGNANFTALSATFSLKGNWLPGQKLILRWDDVNDALSDDGLAIDNFTFSAIPPVAPTIQDNSIFFTAVSTTSLTVNWLNGNGINHLVKMKQGDPFVPAFTNPTDLTDYPANTVYGGGEQAVYNSTGSSVTVTNLNPGTQYSFRVYGFNGTGASARYNTSMAQDNPIDIFTTAASPPTKLVFISVNGGINAIKNQAFNVVIQSQDSTNNPQIVNQNTPVLLTVFSGLGSISGGTISGVILAGTNTVTISGVKYNTAEIGVQLKVERTGGNSLADGISAPFDVDDVANALKFASVPANGIINLVVGNITVQSVRPDLTVDPNYVGSVTISINSGPGGGVMTGTLTQPVVAGTATFNDIKFSAVGPYTLLATSSTGLTQAISTVINITPVPFMTELVIPKYMGSKSGASTNTNRTAIAVCLQLDNLVPNTTYDVRAALDNIGDGAFYGAGNVWNPTTSTFSAASSTNLQNVFTTNGSGSSGPFWVYLQPSGNASNFGGGQVHSVRVGYIVHSGGSMPSAPNFIGTKQIIALDIASTALTATDGDDGAFLTGVVVPCAAGKYILIYDNISGTGNPVFSYQARQAIPLDTTNSSYTGLPAAMKAVYMQNGTSVSGEWPAVIPIGVNNPNGIRRVEARNADNTIFGFETDADGVWPGGANTLTNIKRSVTALTATDAPISTLITNLAPASGSPGAAVVITGAHLTGATAVNFNGTSATFTVINDNQINTTVPVGATDGIVTVTKAGCSSGLPFDVLSSTVDLYSNLFLEAYYLGGGLMSNPLFTAGLSANPLHSDLITISAMDAAPPHNLVDAQTDTLHTNGMVHVKFGLAVIPNTSYFLKVTQRNHVATWSATAITLTTTTTYIFSNAANKAFADNQVPTHTIPGDPGSFDGFAFAFYSGDIWDGGTFDSGVQDGSVDATDFLQLDPHIQNGDGGYIPSDIDGNGSVDATDFLWLDPNVQNGIGSATP